MASTEIEFTGIKFASADEAIQHTNASGRGQAILLDGCWYVVEPGEADRLAEAGVEFAYLFVHEMPDGSDRLLTVPVNG